MSVILRFIALTELESYKKWMRPDHAWQKLDAPYFPKLNEFEEGEKVEKIKNRLVQGEIDPMPGLRIISNDSNELLGQVNCYWKSKETNWMEVGVVIFEEANWGKGIGFAAMRLWISEIFGKHPELVRLGISTWSGNFGMIRLAEKLGMQQEACYRKARIVDGKYYDALSYGILREEWDGWG